MEETITFHLATEDKKIIKKQAREKRLSMSAFCRLKVLDQLFEKALAGKLELPQMENFESKKEEGEQNVG